MEKKDQLRDYVGKAFIVHDNLWNILTLADQNFKLLKDSLKKK